MLTSRIDGNWHNTYAEILIGSNDSDLSRTNMATHISACITSEHTYIQNNAFMNRETSDPLWFSQ